MGKETEAEAKKCLELLGQKGQPAGTAVQGVQEKTSGYMAAETKLSGTGRWEDGPYGGPITLSIILDPASGGGTWTAQFSGGGRAASVAGSASGQLKGSADSAALSGKVNYRVSIKGGQTVSLSGGISGSLAGSQIKGRWSSGGDSGTFTATVK
jgi:hypothetical protein